MATPPADEVARLCERIRALLASPPASGPSLEGLEHTLTEGYARALALEAERWRLERRIGQLGAGVRGAHEDASEELVELAGQLSVASGRLVRLRSLLVELRERTDAVRTSRGYVTAEQTRG
jgi:hypothetical protein